LYPHPIAPARPHLPDHSPSAHLKDAKPPTLEDLEKRWLWKNSYTTTIHAINSCVLKASKLTTDSIVYRGFAGASLPQSFWEVNETGVRGGVEFGFSSTTTDRKQALHYAAGRASTVFRMRMGMVDRGADVSWLSQYPHERECLFAPLLGIEVVSTEVDASVLVVQTALSTNMSSLTLEQVPSNTLSSPLVTSSRLGQPLVASTRRPAAATRGVVAVASRAIMGGSSRLTRNEGW
jgi:NLR family CARD domain-containing protein 3